MGANLAMAAADARAADMPAVPAQDDRVERLLRGLKRRYTGRITGELTLPASPGRFAELPEDMHSALRSALAARGLTRLYTHQREAWDLVRRGEHVVVATPTASGKTLCYNLPVLDAVLARGAKALYLFPTKALAQDQVAELSELNKAAGEGDGTLGVKAFTFDGDTPGDARKAVRTRGDIVVSNPDMLHQASASAASTGSSRASSSRPRRLRILRSWPRG